MARQCSCDAPRPRELRPTGRRHHDATMATCSGACDRVSIDEQAPCARAGGGAPMKCRVAACLERCDERAPQGGVLGAPQFLPLKRSRVLITSASACLQSAAFGGLARSTVNAQSTALSATCQSTAARGFRPASAASHASSRSLMRALAPARSSRRSSRAEVRVASLLKMAPHCL